MSRGPLQRLFPDAVLSAAARDLAGQLPERGCVPVGVEFDELLKAGGGVTCCSLGIRA